MHPDYIPLHNGQPGLRALLQIETHEPSDDIRANSCNSCLSESGNSCLSESGNSCLSDSGNSADSASCGPCLDFISSTATLDRYQEIIDPVGWQLESYRRNPVFQNAHNYGDVLFTLGKALITEVRGVPGIASDTPQSALGTPHLFQRIQFATDVNPVARIAYGLYKGKFLNAVSVGFIPLRWQDHSSADGGVRNDSNAECGVRNAELGESLATLGGRDSALNSALRTPHSALKCRRRYLEQELLEVSAVAIPANPDALALGLKSGAIAKSDLADTVELLRCLAGQVNTGATSNLQPATCLPRRSLAKAGNLLAAPQPGGGGQPSLLTFARQLHRILRRA